jgi:hypothetical protein
MIRRLLFLFVAFAAMVSSASAASVYIQGYAVEEKSGGVPAQGVVVHCGVYYYAANGTYLAYHYFAASSTSDEYGKWSITDNKAPAGAAFVVIDMVGVTGTDPNNGKDWVWSNDGSGSGNYEIDDLGKVSDTSDVNVFEV